jgi:hypothetical protein
MQLRRMAALASSTQGGTGVVQRQLGFEYELGNVETYSKDGTGIKAALAKGHVLENRAEFDVTADDPPTGSAPGAMSDLELITTPIDENVAGNRAVLEARLTAMVNYLAALRTHPDETAIGGAFLGANSDTDYDDGVLQATAGLSIGGLANLTSGRTEASAGQERTDVQNEKNALAEKSLVWDRAGKNRRLDARINHAALQEYHAMGVHDARLFDNSLMQLGAFPGPQADLMAAVMSRIIAIPVAARERALPYAKAAAGALMARSDFATVIAALPAGVMGNFANVGAFKAALLNAIRLTLGDNAVVLADTVFPAQIGGAAQLTLTLDDWFNGLYVAGAGRVDQLTTVNYPGGAAANAERNQMESLGSYGARTDAPAAGATQRPIFEFRSLGSVTADSLVVRGLAILDMVRRANDGTEA